MPFQQIFPLGLPGQIGGRSHHRFRHFHTTKTHSGPMWSGSCVERQLRWPVILPHSRMLPSRAIVASFKCSPTILSAKPRLQAATASIPPSDRLRGRQRVPSLSVHTTHPDSARDRFSGCRECIAPNTMVCAIPLRQILSRRSQKPIA